MRKIIGILHLTLCLFNQATLQTDIIPDESYEQFNSIGKAQHTMTKYKGIGKKCNMNRKYRIIKSGPLTEEEEQQILNLHNEYRRKVATGKWGRGASDPQPQAADMMELTWDEELARIAQRWVEQCPDKGEPHDGNRQMTRWKWVGQNTIEQIITISPWNWNISSVMELSINKAMDSWSQEVSHYKKSDESLNRFIPVAEYYAQLVHAYTRKVGCGVFVYGEYIPAYREGNRTINVHIVCNYAPGRKPNNFKMYKIGPAASLCPTGSIASDGLCSRVCLSDEIQCSGGDCINLKQRCDGTPDCVGGDDEENCYSLANRTKSLKMAYIPNCGPESFECLSGRCISEDWNCDEIIDCHDADDELHCSPNGEHRTDLKLKKVKKSINTCQGEKGSLKYQCISGRCIYISWTCDGITDCPDRDDEKNCYTGKCGTDRYECYNGKCIYFRLKCDGLQDCEHGDDEQNCYDPVCGNDKYRCSSGRCIRIIRLCDGVVDCEQGEDEKSCKTTSLSTTTKQTTTTTQAPTLCGSGGYRCLNGRCIKFTWKCDGIKDCADGEDEKDCFITTPTTTKATKTTTQVTNECDAGYYQCLSGRCIILNWYCDGIADCEEGEDERNCGKKCTVGKKWMEECNNCICLESAVPLCTRRNCAKIIPVPYSKACTNMSRCTTIRAACIRGVCRCPSTHVYNDVGSYDECLKIAINIGDPCTIGLQCTLSSLGKLHSIECSKTKGTCVCRPGFTYHRIEKWCKADPQLVDYKQTCNRESICITTNAACIDSRCSCLPTYVYNDEFSKDECLRIIADMRDHCTIHKQCTFSTRGTNNSIECSKTKSQCVCKGNFTYDGSKGLCTAELAAYMQPCKNDSDCATTDAACLDGKCKCTTGKVYHNSAGQDKCLHIATSIGDPCLIHPQCSLSTFGNETTVQCSLNTGNGRCICKRGYIYEAGERKCVIEGREYGGSCGRENVCVTTNAVCINGKCACYSTYVYRKEGGYDECLKVISNIADPCNIDAQCTQSSFGDKISIECSESIRRCKCRRGFVYDRNLQRCKAVAVLIAYKKACTKDSVCATLDAACINGVCTCEPMSVYNDEVYYDECLKIVTNIGDPCFIDAQCSLSRIGNKSSVECSRSTGAGRCFCKRGFIYDISKHRCISELVGYNRSCSRETYCITTDAVCINGRCMCYPTYVYNNEEGHDECLKIVTNIREHCVIHSQCSKSALGDINSTECSSITGKCVCKQGFVYDKDAEKCKKEADLVVYNDTCNAVSVCVTTDAMCIDNKCQCEGTYVYNNEGYYDECLKIAKNIGNECFIESQCTMSALGTGSSIECARISGSGQCLCKRNYVFNIGEQQCKTQLIKYEEACNIGTYCITRNGACINGKCKCYPTDIYHSGKGYDDCLKIVRSIGDPCTIDKQCTMSTLGTNDTIACSISTGRCVCKEGFTYDRNKEYCVEADNVVAYNGSCSNDSVCVTLNAECINGSCQCSSLSVYNDEEFYDECLKIVTNMGDQCFLDSQCTLSIFGTENSTKCSKFTKRCVCKPGFTYDREENKCTEELAAYTESCGEDSECSTVDAVCLAGACGCNVTHVYNDAAYYDECLKIVTNIGDSCHIDLQCTLSTLGNEKSTECSATGKCVCKWNYPYDSTAKQCVAQIEPKAYQETCLRNSECATINAVCLNGRCICDTSYVYNNKSYYDECLKIASNVGDNCAIDPQCTLSDLGNETSVTCSSTGKCICKRTFPYDSYARRCEIGKVVRDYNTTCSRDGECATINSLCLNGVCLCDSAHVYNNEGYYDECLKIAKNIGDPCAINSQCTMSILGNVSTIECSLTGRCICKRDFPYDMTEKQCRTDKVLRGYKETCNQETVCITANAACIGGVCKCDSKRVYYNQTYYDECLKIATTIGDSCVIDQQCTLSSLGAADSIKCSRKTNKCICKRAFPYNSTLNHCAAQPVLGGYKKACSSDKECATVNAMCLSGVCLCNNSYVYNDEGYYDRCLKVATDIGDPCVISEQCTLSTLGDGNSTGCSNTGKCVCKLGFTFVKSNRQCEAETKLRGHNESCSTDAECSTLDAACINETCSCNSTHVYHHTGYYDMCLKISTNIGDNCLIPEQCTLSTLGNESSINCSKTGRCICNRQFPYNQVEKQCKAVAEPRGYKEACNENTVCVTIDAACIDGECTCDAKRVYNNAGYYDECLSIATEIGSVCIVDSQCTQSTFGTVGSIECSKTTGKCICKRSFPYDTTEKQCKAVEVPGAYKDSCNKSSDCATISASCIDGECACDSNYVYNDEGYYDECLKIATKIGDTCIIDLQCSLSLIGAKVSTECSSTGRCICKDGYRYDSEIQQCQQRGQPKEYKEQCTKDTECVTLDSRCVNGSCSCDEASVYNNATHYDECLKIATYIGQFCSINLQCTLSSLGTNSSIECSTLGRCICKRGHFYDRITQKCKTLQQRGYNQTCSRDVDCITTDSECINHVCECNSTHIYYNEGNKDECLKVATSIGDACVIDLQCTSSTFGIDGSTACSVASGRCKCLAGFTYDTSTHACKEREIDVQKVNAALEELKKNLSVIQHKLQQQIPDLPINDSSKCTVGFIKLLDHCYYLSHYIATWYDADYLCSDWGGWLVAIESAEENEAINQYLKGRIKNSIFWTGGNDHHIESKFEWKHTGKPFGYTSWAPTNQYGGTTDNCVYGKFIYGIPLPWYDTKCGNRMYFMCEKYTETSPPDVGVVMDISQVYATLGQFMQSMADVQIRLQHFASMYPVSAATLCPLNFIQLGNNCYYFGKNTVKWEEANSICISFGANLVSIETEKENTDIGNYLQGKHEQNGYWTSGNSFRTPYVFEWQSRRKSFVFTSWNARYPEAGGSDQCVLLHTPTGNPTVWTVDDCSYVWRPSCEKSVGFNLGDILSASNTSKQFSANTEVSAVLDSFKARVQSLYTAVQRLTPNVSVDAITSCPDGFVRILVSCYYFSKEKQSWYIGNYMCKEWGTRMLAVESLEESTAIENYLTGKNEKRWFWIGGGDMLQENKFVWTHSGKPLTYIGGWDLNQPSQLTDYSCMYMVLGKWKEGLCQYPMAFICETKAIK